MLRDYHLIRNQGEDLLFFPASYRLFKLPKDEGDAVIAWQESGCAAPPPGRIGSLMAAAAEQAGADATDAQPWGEIDSAAFRRFFTTPGRRYAVAMYGGEPLLNFQGIKAMVAASRRLEAERGISIAFSITTNGTVFNRERIQFLKEQFFSISVSIDGPKEDHDRHRMQAMATGRSRICQACWSTAVTSWRCWARLPARQQYEK